LKPPRSSWWAGAGRTAVVLENGASFGDGTHPTTGMAIQLLDALLYPTCRSKTNQCLNAIDIGTGSGVLALVAARLGVGTVCGLDIDPCARYEARENIRLNGLEDRVVIRDDSLTGVVGPYDLVLANLRTPTLIHIKAELQKKVAHDCVLIFSGMKADESDLVSDAYRKAGFFTASKNQKHGWGAICLMRGSWLGVGRGPWAEYSSHGDR
ncbi:MAG: 50S ribosomal protein L11 methyltransferase, partial [Desulfosarcina sp.]